MSKFFDFQNLWGKGMERYGLRLKKKSFTHKWWIFFFKYIYCLTNSFFLVLVLLYALAERCFVSHMREFFLPDHHNSNRSGKDTDILIHLMKHPMFKYIMITSLNVSLSQCQTSFITIWSPSNESSQEPKAFVLQLLSLLIILLRCCWST